jgi:hypothetical protein
VHDDEADDYRGHGDGVDELQAAVRTHGGVSWGRY